MKNQPDEIDVSDEEPTEGFLRGIKEFNEREFFECHETLEQVWKEQVSPRREFTQGIIQTAVAFYHLKRNNRVGAIKLFHRALPRLEKFAPVCFKVDVLPLAQSVATALSFLEGKTDLSEADLPLPPIIKMTK